MLTSYTTYGVSKCLLYTMRIHYKSTNYKTNSMLKA